MTGSWDVVERASGTKIWARILKTKLVVVSGGGGGRRLDKVSGKNKGWD